jgi:2-iminobutanoate/2-iminopropanoate deaminase
MTERQALQPEGLAVPNLPYSSVVLSGDLVFTSGQGPFDSEGQLVSEDFEQQAHQTFGNLGLCLEVAGCGFQDVVSVNAFLTDLEDFDTYNTVYRKYFKPPYPVRTTVGVQMLGFKIEVQAIARRTA